ncbi:MarR family winged helix-turn-helix transcriptional regulator [Microbacterium sp. RD1]|uniref:MarR family winged helix-turn-helix transcriptional regulator n=1 Tax=Microbacterium sp. RD1 TaxID=3457313 RepID=UPI003FA5B895
MTHEDDLLQLIVAAHAVTRIAALETKNDAPAAQWRTLKLLIDGGPSRVGDLAVRSRVSQPGMTRLVGQLDEAGLVERRVDAADARVQVVSVTDVGRDAYTSWQRQLRDALAPHFAHLDEVEWDSIRAAATILTSATTAEPALMTGSAR